MPHLHGHTTSTAADAPRRLSVLMPVYNEIRTLERIVTAVLAAPIALEIELVVVDDGSTDGSRELIVELARRDGRIRPVLHERNAGKAEAVRTAIREMTGDLAIVQDADLEYSPQDYPVMLQPVLEGLADAVFGSRFLAGRHRRVMYFWHTAVNNFLTLVCNMLNDINLTDMETGYKLVRADVLRRIPLTSSGFEFEPELTTKLARWGLRLYEVPISYAGRTYAEGKKIGWTDGVKALWALLKYRFLDRQFTTHEGFFILQSIRSATRFNTWMVDRFRRFIGNRVLEGGCGIGNLTELLLDRERLVCLDNDAFYVEVIRRRYGHLANVDVQAMSLTEIGDSTLHGERLDTVVCINVLEHIEAEQDVLRGFHDVLEAGGHAIVLVPAHPWLYTGVDKALGHCRRYTAAALRERMEEAGFEVVACEGFNRLGTLGWFVSGKLLGKTTITPGQMKLFEWLMPIARLLERLPLLPHLSLVAVGRKPQRQAVALEPPARQRKAA